MPDTRYQSHPTAPDQPVADTGLVDRLTIISRDASPAALEFHRQHLGEQGYAIAGRIERHRCQVIDGPGRPTELFDGVPFYAATFIRTRPGSIG